MLRNFEISSEKRRQGWLGLLIIIGLLWSAISVSADDCDNWGRLVHVGERPGDNFCLAIAGVGGGTTKQLEDAYDYDYFVFYIGYDDGTPINEVYRLALTNTNLSRPQFHVGTFYDDARAYSGQTTSEAWYSEYSSALGGMSVDDFKRMVTLAPNLQHDGVYDYVSGQVVVVQESSDAAIRQRFYAVPVGTVLASNQRNDNPDTPQSEKYEVFFTPPDRGAYVIVVSNYSPTRRRGTLTGSYTVSVTKD